MAIFTILLTSIGTREKYLLLRTKRWPIVFPKTMAEAENRILKELWLWPPHVMTQILVYTYHFYFSLDKVHVQTFTRNRNLIISVTISIMWIISRNLEYCHARVQVDYFQRVILVHHFIEKFDRFFYTAVVLLLWSCRISVQILW